MAECNIRIVAKRECDRVMAEKKGLFDAKKAYAKGLTPCDKNCKKCIACIETTTLGVREHADFTKRNRWR